MLKRGSEKGALPLFIHNTLIKSPTTITTIDMTSTLSYIGIVICLILDVMGLFMMYRGKLMGAVLVIVTTLVCLLLLKIISSEESDR